MLFLLQTSIGRAEWNHTQSSTFLIQIQPLLVRGITSLSLSLSLLLYSVLLLVTIAGGASANCGTSAGLTSPNTLAGQWSLHREASKADGILLLTITTSTLVS